MKRKTAMGRLRGIVIVAAAIGLALTTSAGLTGADASPRDREGRFAKAAGAKTPPKRPLTGVLNINTATTAELTKLPGIGPSKAKRIVQYRAKRGPFRRVRDLRRVKGIGRKTLAKLGRHLSIRGVSTLK